MTHSLSILARTGSFTFLFFPKRGTFCIQWQYYGASFVSFFGFLIILWWLFVVYFDTIIIQFVKRTASHSAINHFIKTGFLYNLSNLYIYLKVELFLL